ncbi:nuclear transport factor 2 family protein [Coprococcus sp. AF19-8AC]|uniref:nuclear transport factor 2 family protein n=1 Tax=unclassified Coprococcus TaxID=2684943 RepID=UPI000E55123E|nr:MULTISPECIES: nuclear transport factor 2 family protein [unclassified Coprococcus]RHR66053.1 nuclear transport factor 2 family protein [Coprococcus sp. AF16-5]RJV46270.1 nuclear transport factor 2 family protein [Coprococcus sp. AF19-8AC]
MGKNETKNYVGGSGMDDMELDERDIQLMEESRKEGKKKLFIALGAIVLAVIVVVIYIVVRKNMTGKSESEDLIKTYMEGLEEADLDKVESVMDPDTIDSDSSKDLVTVFQTYKENNIEYTVSYTMGDGHVAESGDLAAVSSTVYGKTQKEAGISKGYVIPVTGTIMMTFQGQTSPYDLDMDIICYEKDGEWYLGGTVMTTGDTTTDDTTE